MIGKIIAGSSFAGTVGYVIKEQSRVLDAEGVTPPDVREMVQDFKDQTLLNPRIKNAVGHISLSFSSKDTPRMTDALMTQIAKEYMQRMGITDTQYLLVRHLDQPHPHCHLVYNRVGNNGQTFAMRIFDHDVDISYSTREPAAIRDHMATLGVTTMSAASKTEPGGYFTYPQALEQFHVSDERTAAEVEQALKRAGIEPVWKDWDASFDLCDTRKAVGL